MVGWSLQPGAWFRSLTEAAYSMVARHRSIASAGTRFLWGEDVRRPTYFAARRGFLKTLGLIYLIAFISVWCQVDGLMGAHGIIPAAEMLRSLRSGLRHGSDAGADDLLVGLVGHHTARALSCRDRRGRPAYVWSAANSGAADLLRLLPVADDPGGIFFSYQWDILLLETGFVALFLAPWQWRLRRGSDAAISRTGLFLAKALLFKLMFMSGVVKLTSGDASWLDLTALNYHYWTQPLPTVFAWFADQNPEWLKKVCVAATLAVEIVVPFFIWAPRRLRVTAAWLLIALQLAIAVTGNYCFFNLLTIALCLLLFDDGTWAPKREREVAGTRRHWPAFVPAVALIVTLPLNVWLMYTAIVPRADWPRALLAIYARVEPFRIANGYGLFRVMTQERPEIIFEGSTDAFDWQPYEFKWKPGDLKRAPQWNAPHQPRLDWSMWFAALGSQRDRLVAERFARRLLENEPSVLQLLARNPFPNEPPQFIRASLYQYHFASSEERKRTGDWWKRNLQSAYLPTVSLQDFRR